ncbi:MAG: hypothetical protein EXR88_04915 [Gammaproteobacteria bacterium]|nr:hypothetical protein [Gammaproteobacteria bacterium]
MAVLAEALSVIIKRTAIDGRFQGGWSAFLAQLPQKTLCDDGELARVGFNDSVDAEKFVTALTLAGLDFVDEANGGARDLAVVDQLAGITTLCDWLEYGQVDLEEGGVKVAACRLVGTQNSELITPQGWEYSGSMSERFGSGISVPNALR